MNGEKQNIFVENEENIFNALDFKDNDYENYFEQINKQCQEAQHLRRKEPEDLSKRQIFDSADYMMKKEKLKENS